MIMQFQTPKAAKPRGYGLCSPASTIQTPRRETYYPCESLIFKAFNGYYYTFYHNYFIFSKI